MPYQDLGYRHAPSRSALGRTFIPRPEGLRRTADQSDPVITRIEHSGGFLDSHRSGLAVCLSLLLVGLYFLYERMTWAHGLEHTNTVIVSLLGLLGGALVLAGLLYPAVAYLRHRRQRRALSQPAGHVPPAA